MTEPPGAPRKVAVDELTQRSCVLTWKAPEFDGGSPVTGYYVERRQGYTDRWIKVSQCSCTLAYCYSFKWQVRVLTVYVLCA